MTTSASFQTLGEDQFHILQQINQEYQQGMLALNSLGPQTVTFYGGARVMNDSQTYNSVKNLALEFAKRGWGVVSGGGPGVMAAALEGATEGGGQAIAFRINIVGEPPSTHSNVDILFNHFSVRKYMLRQSDVLIYAPGGLGTLDELMENLTLMKTHKYPPKPIFLYDSSFWNGYLDWLSNIIFEERGLVSEDFLQLYKVVDSAEEVISKVFTA